MIGTSKSVWGFDPRSVPGCQLWLDAADSSSLVLSGSNVTQWTDKSLNVSSTTSVAGTNVLTQNAINGRQAILLNGSSSFTGSTTGSGTTLTVCIVATQSNTCAASGGLVCFGRSGFADWNDTGSVAITNFPVGSGQMISTRAGKNTQIVNTGVSTPFIYILIFDGTYANSYFNGTIQTSSNIAHSGTFAYTEYKIGTRAGNSGNIFWTGFIGESIIFNTALTTSQRQQIEGYLAHKWGLTGYYDSSIPLSIPGCQLWLDGADATTISPSAGGTLTSWTDKSGTGKTITINSAPSYSTTGFNGNYPSMTFTSGNNLRITIPSVGTGDIAVFAVWRQTTANTQHNVFSIGTPGGGTETALGWNNGEGRYKFYRYAGPESVNPAATNNANVIGSALQVSGLRTLHINGVAPTGTGTESYNQTNTTAFIGGGTFPLVGQLAELIFYIGTVTTTQRQTIEGYLARKWGFTSMYSALPSIHPFYSLRPHLRGFQPNDIDGCALWLDAADQSSLVLSGSNVTQWTDKSGNGINMTGASLQPTFLTNAFNGKPTVSFAAVQGSSYQVLSNSSTNLYNSVSDISVFMAIYIPGTTPRNPSPISLFGKVTIYIRGGGLGGETLYPWSFNNNGSYVFSLNNFVSANNYYICCFQFNTNQTFFMNGDTGTGGPTAFTFGSSTGIPTYIGYSGYNANDGFNGYISEIITYNTAVTTTQRRTIEGYLAHKWGLTTPIPSTHPFKSILPATSAHFYPTDITGCQLWLDGADSSAVTIATGVSQWTDKSGNANNLTQSTTGSQPTYASSLVTFASNKYLNIPAAVLNNLSTWSLFFVINPISASNWIMSKQKDGIDSYNVLSITYYNYGTGSLESGPVANVYWRSFNAGSQLVSSEPLTTSTLHFCSLTYDGTNLYFYMNGQLNQITSGTFAIQNQTTPNTYTLGALIYPGGDIKNSGVTNFRLGEMITYNTFLTNSQREQIEGYLAHKWGLTSSLYSTHPYKTLPPIFPPTVQYTVTAIGGTIVSTVGTTYHVFRNSGSFVLRRALTVNYLVVGGGGGGGDRHGGGGGAGGVLSGSWSATSGTYTVAVGAGGQYGATSEGGQIAYGTPNGSGTKGGDSLLSGTGISITAYGGGGGGSYDGNPSGTVGSGGGGGGQNLSGVAGTAGQGNAGGSGSNPGAGGGGGAGGAGVAANTGTGGIGTSSFSTHLLAVGYGTTFAVPTSPNTVISGGVAYIAGGGGGCAGTSPGPGGSGGLGGGGRGDWADTNITAGTPNTGGGGGGTRSHPDSLQTTGRNGGSGLVLVWY
jgi:hypothetical protein